MHIRLLVLALAAVALSAQGTTDPGTGDVKWADVSGTTGTLTWATDYILVTETAHKVEAIELSQAEKTRLAAAERAVKEARDRLAEIKGELRKAYGETANYHGADEHGFPQLGWPSGCSGPRRMTDQLIAVTIEHGYAIIRKSQNWCGEDKLPE